jgi:hypothetical protein
VYFLRLLASLYDYQLVKRGHEIAESRTLPEENGKKKEEKQAALTFAKKINAGPGLKHYSAGPPPLKWT